MDTAYAAGMLDEGGKMMLKGARRRSSFSYRTRHHVIEYYQASVLCHRVSAVFLGRSPSIPYDELELMVMPKPLLPKREQFMPTSFRQVAGYGWLVSAWVFLLGACPRLADSCVFMLHFLFVSQDGSGRVPLFD